MLSRWSTKEITIDTSNLIGSLSGVTFVIDDCCYEITSEGGDGSDGYFENYDFINCEVCTSVINYPCGFWRLYLETCCAPVETNIVKDVNLGCGSQILSY